VPELLSGPIGSDDCKSWSAQLPVDRVAIPIVDMIAATTNLE
jgi:hypothetical protein